MDKTLFWGAWKLCRGVCAPADGVNVLPLAVAERRKRQRERVTVGNGASKSALLHLVVCSETTHIDANPESPLPPSKKVEKQTSERAKSD